MGKFIKKPIIIEAHEWHSNGDHPDDYLPIGCENPDPATQKRYWDYRQDSEGSVVRRFRIPQVSGENECQHCKNKMDIHGWIDTLEGGHIVCPGDWIITGIKGERYPCKPDIFKETYDALIETTSVKSELDIAVKDKPYGREHYIESPLKPKL